MLFTCLLDFKYFELWSLCFVQRTLPYCASDAIHFSSVACMKYNGMIMKQLLHVFCSQVHMV